MSAIRARSCSVIALPSARRSLTCSVPLAAALFWVLPDRLTAVVGIYWNEPLVILIAVSPLAALLVQ